VRHDTIRQLQSAITRTAIRAAAGTTIGGTNHSATASIFAIVASDVKEARFEPGFLLGNLLLLLLVGLRRVLAALLATLLAALILLARLLVALRSLLRARLVLVGHESLFSEKDLKKIFQVLTPYGGGWRTLRVRHNAIRHGHVVKRHARVKARKSIDIYLARAAGGAARSGPQ
jgi:hypothetical protein